VDDADVTLLGAFYDESAAPLSSAELTARYGSEFAAAFDAGRAMAVPEPSLSAIALAAIGVMMRRKRQRDRI
jgi:hypothetical protein